ncbi:uncharacterized protein DUF2484 [Rhodobacter aestuarii]|uniref:DUF2484 family protein n=1 Tax=Rhodobacter aestuarii TaxID=453582 RepID=A0A1N7IVW8_9RHOB|nr:MULTISPECIES: DUF2484 family protein [Rhodobacter]PTV97483.1 uncharacterized protein DUF2484 [Rhodobacter aestuarii]SIS41131.1 Protein of unknown function [Rhodobacter aestuarii]SOC05619.1 uncharacterized protein DUF2484 [Rhodobacter sp. JA431]
MTLSLAVACLWVVVASVIALGPQRYHWPAAWGLIAVGVPILGWVTWTNGPIWGLVVLAGGLSVLRWPVRRLFASLSRAER